MLEFVFAHSLSVLCELLLLVSSSVLRASFIMFVACRLMPEIFDPFAVTDSEMLHK